jgi:hypothetical protein
VPLYPYQGLEIEAFQNELTMPYPRASNDYHDGSMRETKKRVAELIARLTAEAEGRLARAGAMTATKERARIVRLAIRRIETCQSLLEDFPELVLRQSATAKRLARLMAQAGQVATGN